MSRTVRGPLARRLHTLVWLLPASEVKNRLLRRFGHVIAPSASLGNGALWMGTYAVGDHSFVGTRCTVLSGARLPDRSVLAAGSLLRRGPDEGPGLYTGSPARWKRALDGAWFHRPVGQTRSLRDRSGRVLHGAF